MNITTLQWNIGGGKILENGKDPKSILSYNQDGLAQITDYLKNVSADIITLQEVHKNDDLDQAHFIASALGMNYWVSDFYADSHIEEGQRLGHTIISKYPIKNHTFDLFLNLNKEIISENGSVWRMHDKGYTRCNIDVNGTSIDVVTTHLSPLGKFGVAYGSPEGQRVLNDVQAKLLSQAEHQLVQADFNLDTALLGPILPALISGNLSEVPQSSVTTPKGKHYDHILYKGLGFIQTNVDDTVLTDHYPVITEFIL